MKEITLSNGQKPVNPIGSCFDASGWNIIECHYAGHSPVMCHGIGIANMPGQEGEPIAHAWIEFTTNAGQRVALDCIWMIGQDPAKYRSDLKLDYIVEYPYQKFLQLWLKKGFPGPYDPKIAALTTEGKAAARRNKQNAAVG